MDPVAQSAESVRVEHLQVLRLEPGDVVVMTFPEHLRMEDAERLHRLLAKAFPKNRSLIIDSGGQVGAMRPPVQSDDKGKGRPHGAPLRETAVPDLQRSADPTAQIDRSDPPVGAGRPFVSTPGLEDTNPGRGPLDNDGQVTVYRPNAPDPYRPASAHGGYNIDPLDNDGDGVG